jgi:hypothetical protein
MKELIFSWEDVEATYLEPLEPYSTEHRNKFISRSKNQEGNKNPNRIKRWENY